FTRFRTSCSSPPVRYCARSRLWRVSRPGDLAAKPGSVDEGDGGSCGAMVLGGGEVVAGLGDAGGVEVSHGARGAAGANVVDDARKALGGGVEIVVGECELALGEPGESGKARRA